MPERVTKNDLHNAIFRYEFIGRAPPIREDVIRGTNAYIDKFEQRTLKGIQANTESFMTFFRDERRNRCPISIPALVSFLGGDIIEDHFEEVAAKFYLLHMKHPQIDIIAGNLDRFRVFYRFMIGASEILGAINAAESVLSGNMDNDLSQAAGETQELYESLHNSSLAEMSDMYLKIAHKSRRYADVLSEDPSGIMLVDLALEEERQQVGTHPVVTDSTVRAATLANRFYKAVYPVALRAFQS